MPSHLTRVIFRSIIANRPLLYRGCLHRTPRPRLSIYNVKILPAQRRTFFDNIFKPRRKVKPAELPPGIEVLSELAHTQREALRLPPPAEISPALKAFFAQKDVRFEDFHVQFAHNAFRYLLEHPREDGQPWLTRQEMEEMFWKLLNHPPLAGGKPHLAFGRALHAESKRLAEKEDTQEADEHEPKGLSTYEKFELPKFILLLSKFGASLEARGMAEKTYAGPCDSMVDSEKKATLWAWAAVLQGLAREDNKEELLATVDKMRQLSVPFSASMQKVLVTYFAERKGLEQAKHWFSQPVVGADGINAEEPLGDTYTALLKACALCGDLAFGQQVVASLLQRQTPNKQAWDAIFLWSAAIGKGPDEIDRMMNVMVRRNNEERQKSPSTPVVEPDIDTVNALIEYAMSKKDSYAAERYVSLGEKRGILPNAKTFTMQIRYRLSIHDVDGARAAYFGLQGNASGDEQSLAAVNELVQALCESKQHHIDDIMAIVDDLHERRARLAPETVAALCILHLRRGETHDAVDLLQVHAHRFTPAQRIVIRKTLAAFIMDGQTSTADAWDTYQIMRNSFPETPRQDRIPILNEFFARKRSDMACHVFFHMRNSTHEDITTNKEVYVAAFTGFARNADADSLELAHNQLKLDLNVEMDTQLRNALMLAYAGTGNNRRALEFWAEIGASKEGPSYNSIAIAFRSCEGMPFGDTHAKSIWKRLKELDIDIDKQIFTAYLSAIARNHLHDEALALVELAEEDYGFAPDLYM